MRRIITFFVVFLTWTLIGVLSKILFMAVYAHTIGGVSLLDWLQVMWHGLVLDMSIAGYVTLIPGLLLIAHLWYQGYPMAWLWRGYFALTAFLTAVAYVSNIGLYGYWGYPLDNTPLLYIKTSPSDAMASLTSLQLICFPVAIIILATAIYAGFDVIWRKVLNAEVKSQEPRVESGELKAHAVVSVILFLLTGLLILPIRGGVDTGTNHTGTAYFSSNIRLNHAAVNPVFSFMESLNNYEQTNGRYRFMDDAQASRIFSSLSYTSLRKDTTVYVNREKPLNVILITLEGFSTYIMGESGHVKGITPCLDKLTHEGLYFTDIYASSYRTDRALVSVHSALPAQPTMSIMDMPHKSTSLPSIAHSLDTHGYLTTFYYGGDTNYSNMQSYFIGTGFQKVVSDADFKISERSGKWGVPDGIVYDRIISDIRNTTSERPFFRAFMTESSHEPFDVPNYKKFASPEENAFSYADYCLGKFVDELRQMPCWRNTLIIIVPDHLGVIPDHADNYAPWRYHVPLLFVGGAMEKTGRIATVGSQLDIAATLLAMLRYDHSEFIYSKDLLDPDAPHYAFFAPDDAIGFVTADTEVVYDNISGKMLFQKGKDIQGSVLKGQAFLQKLYDDIDKR